MYESETGGMVQQKMEKAQSWAQALQENKK